MNRKRLAKELTKIARSLRAGTGAREFQEQIEAISKVQTFIEEEAKSWSALQDNMVQTNLRRASRFLASARKSMYDAWDLRDKLKPV